MTLDKELESRGHWFARCADDFIILVRSQRAGKRVIQKHTPLSGTEAKAEYKSKEKPCVPWREMHLSWIYIQERQDPLESQGLLAI